MARGAIFVGVLLLGVLLLTQGVKRDTPKKGRGRNGQTRTGKAEQGASTLDPDVSVFNMLYRVWEHLDAVNRPKRGE